MQTVYLGNTLINDIFVGSGRQSDVFNVSPTIVTSSLVYYFDAAYSSSAAGWRAVLPYTGSSTKTGSLTQTTYTSTYPQSFNLTGSAADINFAGAVTPLTTTNQQTIILYVKPVNDTGNTNLMWWGTVEGNRTEIQMSGSIGGDKFLRIVTNSSSSVAQNCKVSLNDWHQIVLTTDGTTTFSAFNVWVDDVKQSISGSTVWAAPGNSFWVIGTFAGQRPLSGSVVSHLVYDRKLSDNEILQNLRYFRARLGYF